MSDKLRIAVVYNKSSEDEYERLRRKLAKLGRLVTTGSVGSVESKAPKSEKGDAGKKTEPGKPVAEKLETPLIDAKEVEAGFRYLTEKLPFKPEFDLNVPTEEEEYGSVAKALCEAGYDAYPVNIEDKFHRLILSLVDPEPDLVFNCVEFFGNDAEKESCVAGMYELMGIPYTGSPPLTLAMCQRKDLTKRILTAAGLKTPRFRVIKTLPVPKQHGLRYPIMVKPAWEDASAGVEDASVVEKRADLEKRIGHVLKEFEQPVLLEEFIDGREVNVSIVGNDPPEALPVEEMDFSKLPEKFRRIVSYDAKWNPLKEVFHKAAPVCPAKLEKEVEKRVKQMAIEAFKAMGCRDYARVDMRLDKNNEAYVLEINPNPDISEGVAFMASAEAEGYEYEEMLELIVETALKRYDML